MWGVQVKLGPAPEPQSHPLIGGELENGTSPWEDDPNTSSAGVPCAYRHDLVLLFVAELGQDGQDGRGQQDALQHVDDAVGSQHAHSSLFLCQQRVGFSKQGGEGRATSVHTTSEV